MEFGLRITTTLVTDDREEFANSLEPADQRGQEKD